MSNVVTIDGKQLLAIEHNGQRVVTLTQVDTVHVRIEGTAYRNFREHKHRLIEGEDYFKVGADEFRRHLNPDHSKFASGDVILLAESGYLMLVKSFTDDLAWSVQRQLVNGYFRSQQSLAVPQTMAQALRLAAEQAEQLEKQAAQLVEAASKVEYMNRYVAANGSLGFRQVAKLLQANEHEFRAWLQDKKIMYRLGGVLTPYQNHIDEGRFAFKTGVSQANEHAYAQALFTTKGVTWVADKWVKRKANLAEIEG